MARDPRADAMHRLYVAHANYEHAVELKRRTREQMNQAMLSAVNAGITRAEISRIVGTSAQRVGAIISELEEQE